MDKEQMPAAEADSEAQAYELAFHVLPTVAEGEVSSVVDAIKSHITTAGGTITGEEAPARFELAYEIVKHLEGRNRKFTSAYFGWMRFTIEPAALEELAAEVEGTKDVLRSLIIRLTKIEEENPFMFHDSIKSSKSETVVIEATDEDDEDEDEEEVSSDSEETETDSEEAVDGEEDK